jgi:hypothetical protein
MTQTVNESQNWTRFDSADGNLEVQLPSADWPITESLVVNGDSSLGRGTRGAVPMYLLYESKNLQLQPHQPLRWRISLRANAAGQTKDSLPMKNGEK